MALVVLRLKLALQRRAWGGSGVTQRVGFVVRWLVALLGGIAVAELVEWSQELSGEIGAPVLVLLLTLIYVSWVALPVLVPGLADASVDPLRLAPYPLRSSDQAIGLTLGALVSPTALFTFLAAVGGVAVADESLAARIGVVVLSVVYVVLCVTSSRAAQAAMADVLRGRRGRDAIAMLVLTASVVLFLVIHGVARDESPLGLLLDPRFIDVLGWLPPGSMAEAISAGRDATWGAAAAHALVGILTIAAALGVWTWTIARLVRGGLSVRGRAQRGRVSTTDLELVPWPLSLMTPGPAVAAAAQQLRYAFFRSPKAIQSVVIAPVLGVLTSHALAHEVGLVAGAVAFSAFAFTLVGPNVFAFDDDAFTCLVTMGAPYDAVLRGKAWTPMLFLGPVCVVFVGVEAAWLGQWSEVAAALLSGLSLGALALGLGAVLGVLRPLNLVTRSGGGGHALTTTLAAFAVVGLVIAVGAYLGQLLTPHLGTTTSALALALVTVPITWGLHRLAGRMLSRDPWRVERMLAA
jgi:ABC-2 type transport system permease protein